MPRTKPQNMATKGASSTTWADVAGVEEVRAELDEVVDFLRDPKRFEALGAKVPKGLLLYGPPGTGKTLLAKAVAHESGANFYSASASSFVEMFAGPRRRAHPQALRRGAEERAGDRLHRRARRGRRAARPGTASTASRIRRSTSSSSSSTGSTAPKQVVVMGASNRLQDLDQALLRPGRFDRQMLVPPPDLAGREAILARAHARQAARRGREPLDRRAADRRPHRRRAREHLQRGGDRRRPARRQRRSCRPTSTARSSASSPGSSRGRC